MMVLYHLAILVYERLTPEVVSSAAQLIYALDRRPILFVVLDFVTNACLLLLEGGQVYIKR